jgi:hypothetical protein
MPIKTFKGQVANEGMDTIRLSTADGMTGYRIVKFQLMTTNPGTSAYENVAKIYTVPLAATPDGEIDFRDPNLLAVGYLANNSNNTTNDVPVVVFDNMVFNQDIYITNKDMDGTSTQAVNYYLELEQLKLNANSQAVATLKNIRANTT